MAKPNYQFEKRQRDLAKKQKQEEKRRAKLANKVTDDASHQTVAATRPDAIPAEDEKATVESSEGKASA